VWVAFLSLQVVEDGTIASVAVRTIPSSLRKHSLTRSGQPMLAVLVILFVGSTYIFLDTAFTLTTYFQSDNPAALHSAWLFVLTIIWPAVAAAFYFAVQLGVVVRVLREKKPLCEYLSVEPDERRHSFPLHRMGTGVAALLSPIEKIQS
jgi:ABC-type uncharacterized transport system permease subunit